MSRPRVTSDLLTHYGRRRAAERDAVGCFTHSSEQGGSRVRQVEPLKHSKQAGSKTLGTNQTTVGQSRPRKHVKCSWTDWKHGLLLDNGARRYESACDIYPGQDVEG